MTIEGAILARVAAYGALNALIGTRVYALRLPETPTLPALVFTRVGEDFEHASGADETTRRMLVQFSTWSTTYDGATGAKTVADQVHAAFSRFSGTLDSTVIEGIFAENVVDLDDDETKLYHVAEDFTIWYRA